MKRILYIWKGPFPFEIRIQKICESLVHAGFDVTVLCRWNGENNQTEVVGGVKILRAGYKKSNVQYIYLPYNPFWRDAISSAIEVIKPDLIINREFYLLTETIAGARENSKQIPVIVDMAENYPAALREFKNSQTPLKQFLFRKLELPDKYEKFIIPQADGVIVVCDEQIPRLTALGVNENAISVVHNTPPLDDSLSLSDRSRNPQPIRFIHHGYLSGDKSILEFLRGFLMLLDRRQDIEFTIAGKGECFEQYRELVSRSIHKDKIKLTGGYDISQLNGIISNADIGVLPFQPTDFNNYTIQNKIFDYFANSLPVLVSKCTPLMRIIKETNAGFIADCSTPETSMNAINEIIEKYNPDFAVNAFYAYKNKYNWKNDETVLIKFVESFV